MKRALRFALGFPGLISAAIIALPYTAGCHRTLVHHTDRQAYGLIEDRQRAALGATTDMHIGHEPDPVSANERMYRFNPNPVTDEIPESFHTQAAPASTEQSAEEAAEPATFDVHPPDEPAPGHTEAADLDLGHPEGSVADKTESIFDPAQMPEVTMFGLRDALRYAMRQGRELQDAKEDLYLATLDLTLERHLWTPQFVASVLAEATGDDPGGLRDEERAFQAVSNLAVSQRLPFGGDVTARMISTLVRDLGEHVTQGESGSLILEANIPLFRGAGRVAYESRYAAERELIYAVRAYERFRRSFVVSVAAAFFELQQLKAAIRNTFKAYESRKADWEKADFVQQMGQARTIFEAPRARASLRQAEAALVSAKERYASALDRFKITIGMPVEKLLDVLNQEEDEDTTAVDMLLPVIDESIAVAVALRLRLDLLNVADRVDDADRGVLVAKNRILPDLDLSAAAFTDSDPERLNSTSFNLERGGWRAGLQLRMDDRKAERNAYRESIIRMRRAERFLDQARDNVRADVRRALRRIAQQQNLRLIQAMNVEENELRADAARAQFELGRSTNRDVVDAENDLLNARNDLAGAVAAYRVAILEFRRDTGTLRVTDDGRFRLDVATAVQPAHPAGP